MHAFLITKNKISEISFKTLKMINWELILKYKNLQQNFKV